MPGLTVPPNITGSSRSDTIQGTASAFDGIGIQVDADGAITTRGGNDTVSGTATGGTGYGISDDGHVGLGAGDDYLVGTSNYGGQGTGTTRSPASRWPETV